MRKDLQTLEEKMEEAKRLVELGYYIQGQRSKKGKSLAEVGSALNVSSNYVSELERGKKMPSDYMVRDIAKYFEVPEETLFKILGKIPLNAIEFLENHPSIQKGFSKIRRMVKQKKITREQEEELIEEMTRVYNKFLETLE